jgi:hypothetical protein
MAEITLFLTRKPVTEFTEVGDKNVDITGWSQPDVYKLYGWTKATPPTQDDKDNGRIKYRPNGLWSTLGVMQGPKVLGGEFLYGMSSPPSAYLKIAQSKAEEAGQALGTIEFRGAPLLYVTPRGAPPVDKFDEYTTAERYRNDYGEIVGGVGYIMLQPRPQMPYPLQFEPHNDVVAGLRPGQHRGNCLRILGTTRPKEDAILIHECPSIGWVTGCIGPRPLGDKAVYENKEGNPSYWTFNKIYDLVVKAGGRATLVVLDWG